ncbi:MAG: heme exporter protein CcmB [OCS116 cluster bacterium]|uniref:Heme exporter protein B n=1 Tax=OCS116 cluster bacterium TaxID=2030921 RepID=A0A2A4Z1W1_9PROT|nr:heme exporter protein CcmB [OCS116 cluster bacterium]
MKPLLALLRRDINLFFRSGGGAGQAIGFYLVVIILFPFGVGPDINLLARISIGVLWVVLLLAILLSAERIFADDLEDGSLTLLLTAGPLPELVILVKLIAHWVSIALPLLLITPFLALMLNLPAGGLIPLIICMSIGSLGLCALATIGASILVSIRRANQIISLLILPLYIPILIFGVSATSDMTYQVEKPYTSLLILLGITLISLIIAPFASAQALKANL